MCAETTVERVLTVEQLYSKAARSGSAADCLTLMQRICRTDTGSALCDSGSIYGYKYQQPDRAEALDIENLNISAAHHLAVNCRIDKAALRLDKDFRRFAAREDQQDNCWLETLACWLEDAEERGLIDFDGDLCNRDAANSYNWENDVDQVFQFCIFQVPGEGKAWNSPAYYIAVQVHCGCDVRGGYSRPWIFRLYDFGGPEYFLDMQVRGNVSEPGEGEEYPEDFDSAYQISEAAEFKDGAWYLPDGRAIDVYCTAYGI